MPLNSKTVGILTLHRANNYGAMLQAYALSTFLQQQGHDVFLVDYRMERASIADYVRRPRAFLSKLVQKNAASLRFLRGKLSGYRGKRRERQFNEIFEDFRSQHLNITEKTYDYNALKVQSPAADAFIVGSDQVWAADFVFSSPAYLLGFAPAQVKRISYAASFGKAHLERYLQPEFKKYIKAFDAVSVREQSGVQLVKRLAGFEPAHVVDPTLLLTSYDGIIDYSLVPDEDYLFSYRLGQDAAMSQWMNDSVLALSSAMQLPVYEVSTNSVEGAKQIGHSLRPTPGQLLGLIAKSRFVATNSFHGTVFSLLFKRDFLALARDSAPDKQNLRLIEFLASVELGTCFCDYALSTSEVVARIHTARDFGRAHAKLALAREASAAFLHGALT